MPLTIGLQAKKTIVLTEERFAKEQANNTVKTMANFLDSVMEKGLIESNRYGWFFVGPDNAPIAIGEHFIDRKKRNVVGLDLNKKDDEKKWQDAEWHERLFVFESTIAAVAKGNPLVIDIDCDYFCRNRLDLYGGLSSDFIAPAAKLARI